ncbi:MAG TPA: asparagine synthase (glutamine-hydrolyzing) [Pyrinomonadaceae bacterium]|jgi:asparagine synthase (glutamine-hydrolysing)|nr:asparagine synthase (glutamine-hydrolyzing) [Pyrinomonadaceae bacterium]
MCGINGIALSSNSRRSIDVAELERMRDVLTHRGPDDAGIFVDARVGRIGLGHRRLSIVDVASGHQPMTNEDNTLHIIYNGEIYNHADFRASLEQRGHVYNTHCDTETILHLYEEHGPRCVEHLRGMFAFAIWDQKKCQLFIARDRLGVKPLYYAQSNDGSLYFGSEIKALLETGAIRAEMNYRALPDYLANHAPSGEQTLFSGIKRLLPGHTLTWADGTVQVERYWDISFQRDENSKRSDADYIVEWGELFRESVRLRLMADVPLGMFLSGGIDSSAIAAVMSGMVAEPIKTFSVAFAEREANELEYARLVAKTFKTSHHEVVVSPEEFFGALPKLVWHEDEPIAHPSSVALYFVSQLASQHVKVVLTGEGSDELLAGYGRYRKTILNVQAGDRYQQLAPAAIRNAIRQQIEALPSSSRFRQKLMRTFLTLSPDLESIYFDNFAVFPRAMQKVLLSSETRERLGVSAGDPYAAMRNAFAETDATSLLDRLLYADIKTYLHELLMKQDQMSMAASIESRVPFLDHKLVEFSAALPERMKLRGATTKYVLRESMKGLLPEAILSRPKMGFPVPVGSWFRGAFRHVVDEYALSERAMSRGIFEPSFVRSLVKRHQEGGEDHSERLWALVNFEIWQRQFFDADQNDRVEESQLELAHV